MLLISDSKKAIGNESKFSSRRKVVGFCSIELRLNSLARGNYLETAVVKRVLSHMNMNTFERHWIHPVCWWCQ